MENTHLKKIISKCLDTPQSEISKIALIPSGLANRSYHFFCNNNKYIIRLPRQKSALKDKREHELEILSQLKNKGIADTLVYYNIENEIKISKFIENARPCDMQSDSDILRCTALLKKFHKTPLELSYEIDIFAGVQRYESLWHPQTSVNEEYYSLKKDIFAYYKNIENIEKSVGATHLDAHKDNFLLTRTDAYLIDWEFAGICDQHMDIASFITYEKLPKSRIDYIIDCYFDFDTPKEIRRKIYYYISLLGLFWYSWANSEVHVTEGLEDFRAVMFEYAWGFREFVLKYDNHKGQ